MSLKPLEFEKPIVELEQKIKKLQSHLKPTEDSVKKQIEAIEAQLEKMCSEVYSHLSPWQRVQIARHTERPRMLDYMELVFTDFCEVHGDRRIGDDSAMPGGFAKLGKQRCVVIGHQKGGDTKENLKRNFGSAHPEGYRKAMRLMKLAEKFNLPVVSLIDTPGAYPGIGAEERNIAEAIAYNLREMMLLKVPIIAVVLGEGGSGGALGIGVADKVLMMQNAYYSVISPEGCAAILWKHRKYAPEAAEAMRLVAPDLLKLGLIDEIIEEVKGGAHRDKKATAKAFSVSLKKQLEELLKKPTEQLLNDRYVKYRAFGEFHEKQEAVSSDA